MAIIDFHSHILPKMDDGSRDYEMTAQMLQSAREQQIDTIVATPHFYADSMIISDFIRLRQHVCLKVKELALAGNIRIVCGAEVAFFSGIGKADEIDALLIGKTDLLLLEMPFRSWSEHELYEIDLLLRRGIQPVIAHLERFYPYQKDKEIIPALLDMPVYIQLNAECLLDWKMRRRAMKLFKNRQAHLLGSDCHNMSSRPENLGEGRKVLERKLGKDFLEELDEFGTSLLGME